MIFLPSLRVAPRDLKGKLENNKKICLCLHSTCLADLEVLVVVLGIAIAVGAL